MYVINLWGDLYMIITYVLIFIASIISGLGIGGGSVFLLVNNIINNVEYKEAMVYSLVMFISVGISNTIKNISDNKKFNKKIFLKLIPFVVIGSVIGSIITNNIDDKNLKLYFNIFMVIIGIYEIISSLITMKNTQNNIKERS